MSWAEYLLFVLAHEEPPEPEITIENATDFGEQLRAFGFA